MLINCTEVEKHPKDFPFGLLPISVGERMQQKWNHLKFRIPFAALLRFFFIIRSFRFQFVPSLSYIDFQLLVYFFFEDSRFYSPSRIRCRSWRCLHQNSKLVSIERNKLHFPAGAKHRLAQIGSGFYVHTPTSFENWFIGLPAGLAGKQLLIRKSHERVRSDLPSVCVCSFIELTVA